MKNLVILILVTSIQSFAYALDCEKIFQARPAIDCERLSGEALSEEKDTINKLLLNRQELQRQNPGGGVNDISETLNFIKSNKLCSDETLAVMKYTGGDYQVFNSRLRAENEDSLDQDTQRKICLVSRGLNKLQTTETILYRGMALKKSIADNYLTVENIVEDRGFVSTSTDRDQAIRFSRTDDISKTRIILKFISSKGHAIKELSYSPIEDEYLINRGQKFEVQSVTLMSDWAWIKEYYLVELRAL